MEKTVRVFLEGIAHGGDAFGRVDERVIFVPFGAPGEEVMVEIEEGRRGWARGRLTEILSPSADRVEAPCPYFGQCPGCQLQHLGYGAQLREKTDIVRDKLTRAGGVSNPNILTILGAEVPWRYRNYARLYPTPEGALGIKTSGSSAAVFVEECPLFHCLLDELFIALDLDLEGLGCMVLRAGCRTGDQMLILEMSGSAEPELEVDLPMSVTMIDQAGDTKVLVGEEWIHEHLMGKAWRISAQSPFWPNSDMAELLMGAVRELMAPSKKDMLLELGCGVGALGLGMLDQVSGLIALERNPWAISDFQANMEEEARAGLVEGPVNEGLADIENRVDLAIANVPPAGLGPEVVGHLGRLSPRRLIYIAEDPTTLARDAGGLAAAGYRLDQVQPIDMLPQTAHVTVVARWDLAT